MRRTMFALLLIAAAPALANAQEPQATATAAPSDPLAKENWPLSGVDRPLGLSGGMLQVDVKTLANMSKGSAGKPFSVPLGILFGITNELQGAITHTTGLCLSGKTSCPKVYNDLGLQLLFSLFGRGSSLEIATTAALNFTQLSDPMKSNLQIGGAMNWVTGGSNIAILAYPSVGIGLSSRDQGNKEYVAAPIYAYFRAGAQLSPYLFTGLGTSALDGFDKAWNIPAGLGLLYSFNTTIDVGAEFDLLNPFNAPTGAGAADARALYIWLSLRPL